MPKRRTPELKLKNELIQTLDPSRIVPLTAQVAGHGRILHYEDPDPDGDDFVLKPLSATEQQFYADLDTLDDRDGGDAAPYVRRHFPKMYGTVELDGMQYTALEDATSGFAHPCVADIKIGTRQYGLDVTPEKMEVQDAKCRETTSHTLGLRLCGCRVWDPAASAVRVVGKYQHRSVVESDVPHALAGFLSDGRDVLRGTAANLKWQVDRLWRALSEVRGPYMRMWGSSLLLLYEGDAGEEFSYESWEYSSPRRCKVVPIDFNHSYVDIEAAMAAYDGPLPDTPAVASLREGLTEAYRRAQTSYTDSLLKCVQTADPDCASIEYNRSVDMEKVVGWAVRHGVTTSDFLFGTPGVDDEYLMGLNNLSKALDTIASGKAGLDLDWKRWWCLGS